jgi:glycosyltransferase involved in cell wall biosynthesis
MKVLFVSSGNSKFGISPIVKNQGESLRHNGIDLDYFTIKGKGIKGYLKNIPILKKYLKSHHYDIVHAHFSLSAIVATLSGANPLIVSLMGSDAYRNKAASILIKYFSKYKWNKTIVKTNAMKNHLRLKNALVIPNGVDLKKFEYIPFNNAIKISVFNPNKKHILFMADPKRPEKNYILAKQSYDLLNSNNIDLHVIYNIFHDEIPYYLYSADVLLLTSLWEGSPNIIKEAMACNLPIVSTDVGDVKEIIGNTDGCYICSYDPVDVAEKIEMALSFGKRTNGRERIIELGLDSDSIAKKIIQVYEEVLKNKNNSNIKNKNEKIYY